MWHGGTHDTSARARLRPASPAAHEVVCVRVGRPMRFAYGIQRSWSNVAVNGSHDPCAAPLPSQAYFNSLPVLNDSVSILYGGTSHSTKGALIPVNQSKTIEVDLFSDMPTMPWTVSVNDLSGLGGGGPHLSFSWDATTGQNGTKLHLTITVLPGTGTSRFGGQAFIINSTNGPKHESLGYVAQN